MSNRVSTTGMLFVSLSEEDHGRATLADISDFLRRCQDLGVPSSARMDECYLSLAYVSEHIEPVVDDATRGIEVVMAMPGEASHG